MLQCCSILVLALSVALGSFGYYTGYAQSANLGYRLSTSAKALYAVLTLPQDQVDDFMKSYEMFDQEAITSDPGDAKNIVSYYQVINHLCAMGEVEKMYIPPAMDLKRGIFDNQMIWEEKGMADKLDIGPGKKVLDVGCGRGRIAHHVATYSGASVTGINIDPTQIGIARAYANETGLLGTRLNFKEANYNKPFPFEDETFDALYHVQALTYAEDLVKLLKEMNRVLKPGAKISFLDWFALKNFKPDDPYHKKLLVDVKALIGAVRTPYPEEYDAALKEAGFEIISSGEASVDGGHQWPLTRDAEKFYESFKWIVTFLTKVKILPRHVQILMERLTEGGQSFVDADKMGLFTTSWQIIAQKKATK